MPSVYPGTLDSLSNPGAGDHTNSPSHVGQHTNANDAIEAIQSELGTDPAGSAATVRARLDAFDIWATRATTFVVAASDSPTTIRDAADYLCDGTADEVQIQAAIDALPSRGGEIILAPGAYTLADQILITANKRINIFAPGAVLLVPTTKTGLKINQGSTGGNRRGVYIYGLRVDGGSLTDNIGIDFTDTNWSGLFGVQVENIGRGILMHAAATNEFVEGITLEDVVIRNSLIYGIEARRTGGTNSFGQHSWRNVNINVGAGTGFLIPSGVSFYRSRLEVGCWIGSSMTAINIDGDMDNTVLDLFIEGSSGSTSNTAVTIGANATNLDKMLLHLSTWGTIINLITNASNKLGMYQQGRRFYGYGGASPIQVWSHGSTGPSLTFEHGGPAGGRITFGSQAGGVQDVNLYRSSADILATDDSLEMIEQAGDPAAPAANKARLFVKDNGGGKTGLYVRFPTGAVQQIALEP